MVFQSYRHTENKAPRDWVVSGSKERKPKVYLYSRYWGIYGVINRLPTRKSPSKAKTGRSTETDFRN